MPAEADADNEDANFVVGMKRMLGLDSDQVRQLVLRLDTEELIELADSVQQRDKQRALLVIRHAAVDETDDVAREMIDPLFRKDHAAMASTANGSKTLDEAGVGVGERSKKQFAIGDDVTVAGQNATVSILRGPGDTMGVMIGGKLRMVDRREIKHAERVDEMVTGMTIMPSIERMRALAGMPVGSEAAEPAVDVQVIEPAEASADPAEPAFCAMQALEQLSAALPSVRLSDLKAIRQRMTDIQSKMTESLTFAGKAVVETKVPAGRNLKKR